MFSYFSILKVLFLYAEQDVNLAWQSCIGLKNLKINVKNLGNFFCSQCGMNNTALINQTNWQS